MPRMREWSGQGGEKTRRVFPRHKAREGRMGASALECTSKHHLRKGKERRVRSFSHTHTHTLPAVNYDADQGGSVWSVFACLCQGTTGPKLPSTLSLCLFLSHEHTRPRTKQDKKRKKRPEQRSKRQQ